MLYLGETLALTTAVVWAFAVILFKKSGETVHPIALNLFKNLLALSLFVPTMLLLEKTLFYPAPIGEYLLLLFGGVLGIGISDTFFFMSLNLLGAGVSAIVDCMYSPFIIILSVLWLGDVLNPLQVLGAVMIISAILTASRLKEDSGLTRKKLTLGFIYGALAMATMAVSIVMIKPLLDRSSLFWVMELRLAGGILALIPILVFHPKRKRIVSTIFTTKNWVFTLSGSFVGAYLALMLWLAGMKFTQTSTAAALNQSSNIFLFVFAALFLKEAITRKRIIAITLGVIGTFLVTFG